MVTIDPDSIRIAYEDPESADALWCLQQYYAFLNEVFEEPFEVSLSGDPDRDALRPPLGTFLVARREGHALACVALSGTGGDMGEIKRLWVSPDARGLGLGKQMMAAVEQAARTLGMTHLRLDTNRALTAAIAMYRRAGWREIPAFTTHPYAHHWFEKTL